MLSYSLHSVLSCEICWVQQTSNPLYPSVPLIPGSLSFNIIVPCPHTLCSISILFLTSVGWLDSQRDVTHQWQDGRLDKALINNTVGRFAAASLPLSGSDSKVSSCIMRADVRTPRPAPQNNKRDIDFPIITSFSAVRGVN